MPEYQKALLRIVRLLKNKGFDNLTEAQAENALAGIEGFLEDLAHYDFDPEPLGYGG